jgi:RNA polymerase sigma-B factor
MTAVVRTPTIATARADLGVESTERYAERDDGLAGGEPTQSTMDRHDLTAPGTAEQLLRRCNELRPGDPVRASVRARVIAENLPMARRIARRYAGRGEPLDDLNQVAALALVKAVDGYDTSRDTLFVSYAIPCITGALKRHFRDTAWGMRVPRGMQELVLLVRDTSGELAHRLGRPATPAELAQHLDITMDRLLAAHTAAFAYRPVSLDIASTRDDSIGTADLARALGHADPRYDAVDNRLALRSLVAALPERERRIVTMYFYEEMTQAQIGAQIGISQMHVSRLLRSCLTRLQAQMTAPPVRHPAPAGRTGL